MYFIVWLIAIGCIPTDGMAMLIPSDGSYDHTSVLTRTTDLQAIQTRLESKIVAQRLSDVGLTPSEVQQRLYSLTDAQLHQVAQNLDGLQPGGEALILILALIGLVVVVLAIIGLARQA
jgi:hypothetical protein